MTESRQPQAPAMAVTWDSGEKWPISHTGQKREPQTLCVEGNPQGDGSPGTHHSSGCGLVLGIPLSLQGLDESASHIALGRQTDEYGPCAVGRGAFNPVCQARVTLIRRLEFDSDRPSWEKDKSVSPHDGAHNSPLDKQGPCHLGTLTRVPK